MKPLLRQYFYDKLRKSLYHHELKTKVWNNPYFPYLIPDDLQHRINSSGIRYESVEVRELTERIKKHPNYTVKTQELFNKFLELYEQTNIVTNQCEKYVLQTFKEANLIWDVIEQDYGQHY